MKRWIYNNWLYMVGAFAGIVAGVLYWKYVGCVAGSCPITSSPVNSSLYFGFFGAILFSLFKKERRWKQRND